MTYFRDLNTYLHQSSLLIQAYPKDTRITTKYSQPRKPKPAKSTQTDTNGESTKTRREQREPSATLTLKTYHPESGICLKYKTDKAPEVGRLMAGLGRFAKGEIIDLPSGDADTTGAGIAIGGGEALSNGGPAQGDKMEVDSAPAAELKTATQMTQGQQQSGGGKKKKKNKK